MALARAWSVVGLSTLLATAFAVAPCWAVAPAWQALSSGGRGDPHANLVAAEVTGDSGMIAAGRASSGSLVSVRLDAAGAVRWTTRFHGGYSGADNEYALALDSLDNAVVVGRGQITGTGQPGWVLAKLGAADGLPLWVHETNFEPVSESRPLLVVDGSGDVILATSHRLTGSDSRWRLRKLSGLDGSERWRVDWPATGDTFGEAIHGLAVFPGNDIALTGSSAAAGTSGAARMTTVRLAGATGGVVWTRVQDFEPEMASTGLHVRIDGSGDVVAAGRMPNAHLLVRYTGSSGATRWSRTVAGFSAPILLSVDPLGDTLLAGKNRFFERLRAIQFSASGGQRWQRDLTHAWADSLDPFALESDGVGNWLLSARSTDHALPAPTLMTLLVGGDQGDTQWQRHEAGQSGVSATYRAMGVAPDGGVLLAWPARQADGNADMIMRKYAAPGATAAWSAKESDVGMPDTLDCGSARRTSAVAADGSTYYAACRRVHEAGTEPLFGVLVTRVSSHGSEVWTRTLAGPEGTSWQPIDLLLDGQDDVHLVIRVLHAAPGTRSSALWVELDGVGGNQLHQQVIQEAPDGYAGASLAFNPGDPSALFIASTEAPAGSSLTVVRRYGLQGYGLEWERPQPPDAGGSLGLRVSGFDGSGNLVLGGGASMGSLGNAAAYRVLDSTTGDLRWAVVGVPLTGWAYVSATAVTANADLIVAQNIGNQFRLSRHQPSGAEVWSRSYADPVGRGMSVWTMTIAPDGRIGLGGQTADGFLPTSGDFALATVRASDGELLWQTVEPFFNAAPTGVVFETAGQFRTAGVVPGAGDGWQSHLLDYDPQSGDRVAAYPMGGVGAARYLPVPDGSRRFIDVVPSPDGERVRLRRLDVQEDLFFDGFEHPPSG